MSKNTDTEKGTTRVRKIRQDMSAGPLASECPAANPGMKQFLAVDKGGHVQKLVDKLGFDYQLDENGNPKTIQTKNELFYVLETTDDNAKLADEMRTKKAIEPMENLQHFMQNSTSFREPIEFSQGSIKYKKK